MVLFVSWKKGVVSLITLAVLSYERYCTMMASTEADATNYRKSGLGIGLSWAYSLLWAVPPLFGWSRYGPEGPGTTCSVNWTAKSANNVSYIICLFFFCLILPFVVIVYSYSKLLHVIKQKSGARLHTSQGVGASAEDWQGRSNRPLDDVAELLIDGGFGIGGLRSFSVTVVCGWREGSILRFEDPFAALSRSGFSPFFGVGFDSALHMLERVFSWVAPRSPTLASDFRAAFNWPQTAHCKVSCAPWNPKKLSLTFRSLWRQLPGQQRPVYCSATMKMKH